MEYWSDGVVVDWSFRGLEWWRDVERSSLPRPFGEIPLMRGSIGKVK